MQWPKRTMKLWTIALNGCSSPPEREQGRHLLTGQPTQM
jgi:hypothetical protein